MTASTSTQLSASAILAAAGTGERFACTEDNLPKQFLELHGRPIYVWSLTTLYQHPQIEQIVVVAPAHTVSLVEEHIALYIKPAGKTVLVTAGGSTRQESVHRGLNTLARLNPPPSLILIQDAARPFLKTEMIDAVLAAAANSGASTTGISPSDTVKAVEGSIVLTTLKRESLLLVQTPQAARFDWLLNAHSQAHEKGLATTDDAALLEAAGHKVTVVPGSTYNFKITEPDDLALCQALAPIFLQDRL